VVAEGAAACAGAAVLAGRVRAPGPVVLVVTGRNIARARLAEVLGG
jgi:threonine dehydratase